MSTLAEAALRGKPFLVIDLKSGLSKGYQYDGHKLWFLGYTYQLDRAFPTKQSLGDLERTHVLVDYFDDDRSAVASRQLAAYFPPPVPSGDEGDEEAVTLNPPAIPLLSDIVQGTLKYTYAYARSSASDLRPVTAAATHECRCVSLINGHDNDCAYVAAKARA